jgi:ABC-type amino acid transport system permease subunit
MSVVNKRSRAFWVDLGERVGATFLGALAALITLSETTAVAWTDPAYLWPVLGLPTAISLVKGLLANLAAPGSGASLVPPASPGPVLNEGGYTVLGALGLGMIVLAVLLAVLTLLKVAAFSWVVLVVIFVIGLVLVWIGGGAGRRVP